MIYYDRKKMYYDRPVVRVSGSIEQALRELRRRIALAGIPVGKWAVEEADRRRRGK